MIFPPGLPYHTAGESRSMLNIDDHAPRALIFPECVNKSMTLISIFALS